MRVLSHIDANGYSVTFGPADLPISKFFDANPEKRVVVICDENTLEHCWPKLIGSNDRFNQTAEIIQLESGEDNKTLEVCAQIWMTLSEMNLSRNDVIINLGGGVITDLGGFVANTFKRGVGFIQIPTTLLSMVDAAVGGKVGVDLAGAKNLVGNFATPLEVIVDVAFLDSLPKRQIRSGLAEMLKHGLVLDHQYWEATKKTNWEDVNAIAQLVKRSVELKNKVVLNDFKESGERKKLNFGHTVGHAIESHFLSSDYPLLHGEAIAAGMLVEAALSVTHHHLPREQFVAIAATLESIYPLPQLSDQDWPSLLQWMKNDKKNTGKNINFTLLDSIGTASVNHQLEEEDVRAALRTCLYSS